VRVAVLSILAGCAIAQAQPAKKTDSLHELSGTIECLSRRINRSVVQVFASGYALSEERENPRVRCGCGCLRSVRAAAR
jgi:hypothetical protein